jgi:hypothetical protein
MKAGVVKMEQMFKVIGGGEGKEWVDTAEEKRGD